MEQRKRLGKNHGSGYYTSWEKSKGNGCIYCGNPATTREHIPSKAFLTEPYPENLPTIPACLECNNGFSYDENYVACFIDVLKSKVLSNYQENQQTTIRLSKDNNLNNLINKQIIVKDNKIFYKIDTERLMRILSKLARGHAGFEFDHVDFDTAQMKIDYYFLFNVSNETMTRFNEVPMINAAPEVGSRGSFTPYIIQNINTGETASAFAFWNNVQENQYRYQVSLESSGMVLVKIAIYEFLFSEIRFE